tara:strand:- start:225 stop:431 length:207 start_codon:yes stop_codon:yes gene_type:complete
MGDFGTYFLTALALVFVIEGMLYAVFPDVMKRMMLQALALPSLVLRRFGVFMVVCGFLTVYLIQIFSA